MDVEAVRVLARLLAEGGDELAQIAARLADNLVTTPWLGVDAEVFRADWDTHYFPRLTAGAAALNEAAAHLNLEAEEQSAASGLVEGSASQGALLAGAAGTAAGAALS